MLIPIGNNSIAPENHALHALKTQTDTLPTNGQLSIKQTKERTPNLNTEIVTKIATRLGLEFVAEKDLTGFSNLSDLKPDLEIRLRK